MYSERTGTGRKAAMKRGVKFGRPQKLSQDKQKIALRLVEEGKSVSEIAKTFDVNRSTIYRLQDR
jgi:DNA invertase Pin-like site-specific DNA recombinase